MHSNGFSMLLMANKERQKKIKFNCALQSWDICSIGKQVDSFFVSFIVLSFLRNDKIVQYQQTKNDFY